MSEPAVPADRRSRRLALAGRWLRLQLLLILPLLLLTLDARPLPASFADPLFYLALAGLLPTIPLFGRYKRALIACGQARDTDAEPAAWDLLARCQRHGLLAALLPALLGIPAVLAGSSGVLQILLVLGSLTFGRLYRPPLQLD